MFLRNRKIRNLIKVKIKNICMVEFDKSVIDKYEPLALAEKDFFHNLSTNFWDIMSVVFVLFLFIGILIIVPAIIIFAVKAMRGD